MAKSFTIAVDAMSGDHGVGICVPAALKALDDLPQLRVMLVGETSAIAAALGTAANRFGERLQVVAASQVVTMQEHPRDAVRHKKDSSMRVAINQVKRGDAQACVSAGNTGALMATAHFVLKTLPGIERAAIISVVPAVGGHTYMLDLGANAGATAGQLLQFGVMGSIVAAELAGIERPRVGLLNIGDEDIKGHEIVQAAHRLLQASDLNYVGFVEGTDIFSGEIDVVVTDGFTGNVVLKLMEEFAAFMLRLSMSELAAQGIHGAPEALSRVKKSIDYSEYGGALLLGVAGIVIIGHGRSDENAVANALGLAARALDANVNEHIVNGLEQSTSVEPAT